jgi:hypothetical protein
VVLPGIETGTEMQLTCGNTGLQHAKRRKVREITCGYRKDVDGVNTCRPICRLEISPREHAAVTLENVE